MNLLLFWNVGRFIFELTPCQFLKIEVKNDFQRNDQITEYSVKFESILHIAENIATNLLRSNKRMYVNSTDCYQSIKIDCAQKLLLPA